jgi:hypothetical protein
MPTTQLDRELAAYLRGRRDETKDIYNILERLRRLGLLELDQCSVIIDYMSRVDRRTEQMKEDGE